MTAALVAALIVIVQTATGAVWWRVVRGPSVPVLEALGMGMAVGTATATVSGVLLFGLVPGDLAWMVPSLVTVVALPFLVRREPGLLRRWHPTRWAPALLALVTGLVLGLASIAVNLRNYPLTSDAIISTYHQDMPFFEALSTSMATLGPHDSIFMSGADIRYHWFAYAWSGQIAETAGTAPFVMLTRVLPVVALLGSILLAVAWTQRLTRGFWAPTIAVLLIVFGGYVGASYGTLLNFDSPSQAFVTVWMLGLSMVLLTALGRRGRSRRALLGMLLFVAVLGAATTGGKVNSAVVVVAGAVLVALVAVGRREPWRVRAVVAVLVLVAATAVTYVAYLAGSAERGGLGLGSLLNKASSVQGLNPTDSSWGIVVGTVILAVAVLPRWAGVAWLLAAPRWRWQPLTIFSVGAAVTGIAALLLFSGGLNDSWFVLSASAPLSVASAVGVSRAVRATSPSRGWRPSRAVLLAVAGGVVLTLVVVVLWRQGPDRSPAMRWTGPLVALGGAIMVGWLLSRGARPPVTRRAQALALTVVVLVSMGALGRVLSFGSAGFAVQPGSTFSPSEFRPFDTFTSALDQRPVTAWSPDQVAAAAYLRDNVAEGEIVATNIAFSAVVPALSGVPMYIAAIQYQAPYGRPSQLQPLLERERLMWEFAGSPSAQSLAPMCAANVGWLWIDPERTPVSTWEPFATAVIAKPDVIILRVNRSAC